MKSPKLFLGQVMQNSIHSLINLNYKLLRYFPAGRYVTLDIKRSQEPVNVIFDVGANVGQTCLMLERAFPKAHIYSFEPVPDTYNKLKANTQNHTSISCFKLALGSKNELLAIQPQQDSEINSLKKLGAGGDASVTISVETGGFFCGAHDIHAIDLLKIDTEGYELEVLNGFDSDFLKEKVKYIYAEAGFDKADFLKTHYADLEAWLYNLGFVTAGFYEPYRWGKSKLRLGFCNVLFINVKLTKVY